MATRPTADRVREALFSILFDVEGLRVLDVFAGTGAVALEALSRGAVRATVIEHARPALDALRQNTHALGLEAVVEVRPVRAERALDQLVQEGQRFDLLFADPPYAEASSLLPRVLERAVALLEANGRIVLELAGDAQAPVPPEGLVLLRTKSYGEAGLAFYGREGAGEALEPEEAHASELRIARRAADLGPGVEDDAAFVDLTREPPDLPPPERLLAAAAAALRAAASMGADAGLEPGGADLLDRLALLGGIGGLVAVSPDPLPGLVADGETARGVPTDPAEVLVSASPADSLITAMLTLLDPGDEVVLFAPHRAAYPTAVALAGATPVVVATEPTRGFAPDPAVLERALTPRTRLVVLDNPSEPAGALLTRGDLLGLAAVLARWPDVAILWDERSAWLCADDTRVGLAEVAPELIPRLVRVGGSTPSCFGELAVGWAITPRAAIPHLASVQAAYGRAPGPLARAAAFAELRDPRTPREAFAELFEVRRRFVLERLGAIPGLSALAPRAGRSAWVALDQRLGIGGRAFADHLARSVRLRVTPGEVFGAPRHLRISLAADLATLGEGLDRLERALRTLIRETKA